jgi:hypothetical protein
MFLWKMLDIRSQNLSQFSLLKCWCLRKTFRQSKMGSMMKLMTRLWLNNKHERNGQGWRDIRLCDLRMNMNEISSGIWFHEYQRISYQIEAGDLCSAINSSEIYYLYQFLVVFVHQSSFKIGRKGAISAVSPVHLRIGKLLHEQHYTFHFIATTSSISLTLCACI